MNLNQVGLHRSPIIYSLKYKYLDSTTNHLGFLNAYAAPEGERTPQDTLTYSQSMKSPYKKEFINAMLKIIKHHSEIHIGYT